MKEFDKQFSTVKLITKEGKDGRVVAYPLSGYTTKEGKDGRVVVYPVMGYSTKEGKDGRVVVYKI